MKKRQWAVTTVALATSVAVLSGCSSGGGSSSSAQQSFTTTAKGTLNAWGFNSPDEVATSRLDYAKSKLSGVTIKIDETAFDAQKFTTRVASGNVPDVVQMNADQVATYASQNLIVPLDKCYSAHGVNPSTAYYTSVKNDVTYNGHIYGVPQFYQPPAIMLNKRVMDAAGVTASEINTSKPTELLAAIKKMYKSQGGNPTTLGFNPVATGQPDLWILGGGGQLTDANGKPTLDDPNNVKGLELLKKIYDAQGGYAKVQSFTNSFDVFGGDNQFVKDQVGAEVDNQWYVNVLSPYASKVDIAAVPFYASDGKPFTESNGTAFVIPTGSKNKDAACAWALDLTSLPAWEAAGAAREKTVLKSNPPINTGIFTGSPKADQVLKEKYNSKSTGNAGFDQTIATYYQIVGDGKSAGASPAGQAIDSELTNVINSVMLGQQTPMAALKQAQAQAMRAYDQAVQKPKK